MNYEQNDMLAVALILNPDPDRMMKTREGETAAAKMPVSFVLALIVCCKLTKANFSI